uniref:Tudor domain-containing protein n=1 Tax=Pelusios castaneus TaxID=367368 RepID=A0A8C8SKW7_9SAUR
MAECAGEIVYQKEGPQSADCAATDDCALIRSYDRAVSSYKDTLGAGNKDQASESSESSASSGTESEEHVEEEEEKEEEKEEEGSQWKVGDACCAVWSGDGLLYPAHVVSLSEEGGDCVVEYEHYGNREAQKLQELLPPNGSPDGTQEARRMWKVGDICCAVWSGDGLLYPATVRLVDAAAGTCLVEFDGYGNKEQQALEELLPPGGAANWAAEVGAPTVPRGRSPGCPPGPPHSRQRQSTKGKGAHRFPPLPKGGSWWPGPVTFGPPPRGPSWPPERCCCFQGAPLPPPPLLSPPGTEDDERDALACMLLAWHMSGYHTGFYMLDPSHCALAG